MNSSFRENRSGGALLHSYLSEEAHTKSDLHKGKLDPTMRRTINKALRRKGFDGNSRFRTVSHALGQIAGVFNDQGIEVDEPLTADRFRAATGSTSFHVAFSNVAEPMAPRRIQNSMIALQWTELHSGFEIIAYMS